MKSFSLLSAILFLTTLAVALTAYKYHAQSNELTEVSAELETLRKRRTIDDRIFRLLTSFDLENPQDRESHRSITNLVRRMPFEIYPESPFQYFFQTKTDIFELTNDGEKFEILTLSYNSCSVPGSVGTAAVLFKTELATVELVDFFVREESTRLEQSHEVKIIDSADSGKAFLLINIEPGVFSRNANAFVKYEVAKTGFVEQ